MKHFLHRPELAMPARSRARKMILLAIAALVLSAPHGTAQQTPAFIGQELPLPEVTVPEGFIPVFDGRTLAGWHVSEASHHGRTPEFSVRHGMIVGTQSHYGGGGILVSDRAYGNFELYLEVKPDWGNDSGVFLRSTEAGAAYQVTLDYLTGGTLGEIVSEGALRLSANAGPRGGVAAEAQARASVEGTTAQQNLWKPDDWNAVRIRMSGEVPRITVWINEVEVTDFRDTTNSATDGAVQGFIALQIHGADRWTPGGFWRWRNIAVRELP